MRAKLITRPLSNDGLSLRVRMDLRGAPGGLCPHDDCSWPRLKVRVGFTEEDLVRSQRFAEIGSARVPGAEPFSRRMAL